MPDGIAQEDAEAFARSLEVSLSKGDAAPFIRAMDWSALTDRILKDIPEHRGEPAYKRNDLYQSLSKSGGICKSIADKVTQGGAYQFLRFKADPPRLMFRLVDPEGGLDYHDLYLTRDSGGAIRIGEMFLYHFGETLTDGLRKTLVPEEYVGGKNSYGVMMSDVVRILFRENVTYIQMMFSSYEEGKYQRTLDIYDSLPKELRTTKSLQILRLQAAQKLGDPHVYAFVLADLRNQMAGDACVEFLSLDYFFNHHQFGDALECLDRIDRIVGSDVYLNVFRSMALLQTGKHEEARNRLQEAIQKEPRLRNDPTFQAMEQRLSRPIPVNRPPVGN
ncbi:MAG: hypothetical protein Q4D98_14630 [Planctomycetia bacterium]|nr:hypothetical protein [Planctomycetia bacterium]